MTFEPLLLLGLLLGLLFGLSLATASDSAPPLPPDESDPGPGLPLSEHLLQRPWQREISCGRANNALIIKRFLLLAADHSGAEGFQYVLRGSGRVKFAERRLFHWTFDPATATLSRRYTDTFRRRAGEAMEHQREAGPVERARLRVHEVGSAADDGSRLLLLALEPLQPGVGVDYYYHSVPPAGESRADPQASPGPDHGDRP